MDCLTKVILPINFPSILSTLKVDIGLCLIGVVIGEFLAARQGLGYLIIYGSQVLKSASFSPENEKNAPVFLSEKRLIAGKFFAAGKLKLM